VGSSAPAVWIANLNGQVFRLDPASNQLTATLEVSFSPGVLVALPGAVWVGSSRVATADSSAGTLTHLDPASHQILATLQLDRAPSDLVNAVAFGASAVWAATPVLDETGTVTGGKLFRIDPAANVLNAIIPLDPVEAGRDGGNPRGLAASDDAVWVALGGGQIARVDPAINQVSTVIEPGEGSFPEDVAVGLGAVWVADTTAVLRIDPTTNQIVARIPTGAFPADLAVGQDAVWVANQGDGALARIDPNTNQVTATIKVGDFVTSVAVGAGAVWAGATTSAGPVVARIDPASGQVVTTLIISGGVSDLVVSP
jgi:YVTN family beta-propeller protein